MDPFELDVQRAPKLMEWHLRSRCEKVVEALKRRDFDAVFAAGKDEAREAILKMVPADASVSFGGSVTLAQVGIIQALAARGNKMVTAPGAQGEERLEQRRKGMTADCFLTSVNALTIDGRMVNADGTGNRVASMVFGPKLVIAIVGAQKITDTLDEAISRTRTHAAVMNARRLSYKTPCAVTGTCSDCDCPDRMCRAWLILERKPHKTGFSVVVVGEPLGF